MSMWKHACVICFPKSDKSARQRTDTLWAEHNMTFEIKNFDSHATNFTGIPLNIISPDVCSISIGTFGAEIAM